MATFAVRNQDDDLELDPWIVNATSGAAAAHKYLAAFWSAEQREDGTWFSPTYEGDIDGADLLIEEFE